MYADKALGNGHSYLYSKINITSKDEITGLVRTQQWQNSEGHIFSFYDKSQGKKFFSDKQAQPFVWVISQDYKISISIGEGEQYDLVWKQGILEMKTENDKNTLKRASKMNMDPINEKLKNESFSF